MALEIVESCVNCWACEPLCPNKAIFMPALREKRAGPSKAFLGPLGGERGEAALSGGDHFLIDADKCTECIGDHAKPQCVEICPIEGAIVNELNEPMNPAGSLTGIPPERWAAAQREIAAR